MDRNTIIGFSLIALLLFGYMYLGQPSEAELKKQKKELAEKKKKEEAKKQAEKDRKTKKVSVSASDKNQGKAEDSVTTAKPAVTAFKEEFTRLESKDLIVDFSTKGGKVYEVQLKGYESYDDYAKKDGKITPLSLFKGDNKNELEFSYNGKTYNTGNKEFKVVSHSKNKLVLEHNLSQGSIRYTYTLKDGYDLKFDVSVKGLANEVPASSVLMNWNVKMAKTERLLSEQRKVSTICFQNADGELDWTNEISSDKAVAEQNINWVAYKQSYFSSILEPEKPFEKKGTEFKIYTYKEGSDKYDTHIKSYASTFNLGLNSTENSTTSFNWYFGPNDYKVLKSYDKGYDDILNWGWGVFRWINLYAVQPLFSWFMNSGIAAGIAIFLLTLVLKLFLMPIQWKMFVSSAKMRILKPEIDAINAKYPNPEDRMKKQMDMMALQRESGASPLAGCLPMLLQMPILLAVFRFFPASFDLRQRSFLWAEDLSSYDSIWDFGTTIPIYGDHMSLFTLLMAATTLIYTYLNSQNVTQQPQPGMPNMKVIMYIFPVMMIFFFNNYSSGLSYYYFISTLMTILLMFAIKKFFVDEEKLKEKMAASRVKKSNAKAANVGKKKSGFMARLEEAQRLQQEQMKNRKKK